MKKSLLIASGLLLAAGSALVACGPNPQTKTPVTYNFSEKAQNTTYSSMRKARGYKDMGLEGRTLVIPVEFADYPHTNLYGEEKEIGGVTYGKEGGAIENIYKVNFGTTEETQWESCSSFYNKSSYGKAHLTGAVVPWYTPYGEKQGTAFFQKDLTARALHDEAPGYNGAKFVLNQALDYLYRSGYKKVKDPDGNYYKSAADFFKYFDGNNDGYIDNIQCVYSCPPHVSDNDGAIDNQLFWAFRTTSSYVIGANIVRPSNIMWLSYETFFENGYYDAGNSYHAYTNDQKYKGECELDSHTLVHETGHTLGSEDYYTESRGDTEAAGGFLMMSNNVGDHDPWTKAFYGWTDPTVVLDSTEVTLDSFQSNGSSVIVPANGQWSYDGATNTLLDEFLMLEYWTPDGLNAFDCAHKYAGIYPKGPETAGLKIWHVDARLGSFKYVSSKSSYIFQRYETALISVEDGYVSLAHFNDVEDTNKYEANNFKLLETMRKDGTHAKYGTYFSEANLWGVGESFDGTNFNMNNGNAFGYKITVKSIENGKMTLSITK